MFVKKTYQVNNLGFYWFLVPSLSWFILGHLVGQLRRCFLREVLKNRGQNLGSRATVKSPIFKKGLRWKLTHPSENLFDVRIVLRFEPV